MNRKQNQHLKHGFTLIELLVVIAIMIVSIGIIIPSIDKFIEMTYDGTAKNGINTATSAIRAYATRSIGETELPDAAKTKANYNGVAIIFTPACELRMVETDLYATDSSNVFLQAKSPALFGYKDIAEREYITIPKDAGVVGILEPSGTKKFISPPFAIRFDKNGVMQVTDPADDKTYVYYDGNYDGNISLTGNGSSRGNAFEQGTLYKVHQWDPYDPAYTQFLDDNSKDELNDDDFPGKFLHANDEDEHYGKYKLPFEKIEAVIGIIIYSKRKLRENGGTWPGGTAWPISLTGCEPEPVNPSEPDGAKDTVCDDFENWLKDNGEVMFFSRYTGAALKHK